MTGFLRALCWTPSLGLLTLRLYMERNEKKIKLAMSCWLSPNTQCHVDCPQRSLDYLWANYWKHKTAAAKYITASYGPQPSVPLFLRLFLLHCSSQVSGDTQNMRFTIKQMADWPPECSTSVVHSSYHVLPLMLSLNSAYMMKFDIWIEVELLSFYSTALVKWNGQMVRSTQKQMWQS